MIKSRPPKSIKNHLHFGNLVYYSELKFNNEFWSHTRLDTGNCKNGYVLIENFFTSQINGRLKNQVISWLYRVLSMFGLCCN